jgi:serine/threonine protein kinase/tetratricopeptide (TPR) repeat protein
MPAEFQRVKAIFLAAVEKADPAERAAYLRDASGGDAALLCQVEALLGRHEEAGSFLESPPVNLAATVDTPAGREPSTAAPVEDVGARIGPYRLLQKLGEGGMGTVWEAEQTEPVKRHVALKVIKAGMDSAQVIARFEAERQALALMDHPNIARVFDAGCVNGRLFFVMELVKGVAVTTYCDQEHMTPQERLALFVPVCQAVQHAHQKGIIHRDLKPSNVLIGLYDGKPVPKVIDFGVAKATAQKLTERTLCTEVGSLVGTLEYMAPEQAELNNLDIDTRADIYSLGVLLYELLTGSPPFTRKQLRGAAFTEMLRLIREVEPPRPSTMLSGSEKLPSIAALRKLEPKSLTRLVHGDLDWIAMKCLEKERGRRYETANGLALDVQRFLADEPVSAGPPSASYRMRKFLRRRRRAVLTAGFVLLFALAGLSVSMALIWQAKRETDDALVKAEAEKKNTADALADAVKAKKETDNALTKIKDQNEIIRAKKEEAERAAATVIAVDNYLVEDLLGSADPELALGRKLTVLEVLTNAERKIDAAFPDQPLVEAAVRLTLGNTFLQLGEYRRAEPHLARAVQLRQRHLPADHPQTLRATDSLAVTYQRLGKLQEALRLHEKTLKAQEKALGPNDRETLLSRNNLAVVLRSLGRYEDAYRLSEETLAARERLFGPADKDTLQSQMNLCVILSDQGKWQDAQERYEEVIATLSRVLDRDHPDVLVATTNLAGLLKRRGKLKEAQELYEMVLEACTRVLGPKHPRTLATTTSLAFVVALRGKIDAGRKMLAETVERLTEVAGEESAVTLNATHDLAVVLTMQGRTEEARKLLEKVVRLRGEHLGRHHPEMPTALMDLAVLLKKQGKLKQAREALEEARELLSERLGKEHPYALCIDGDLGEVRYRLGEKKEGLRLLQAVVEKLEAALGPAHPHTLTSRGNLAILRMDEGQWEQARQLMEKNLELSTQTWGAEHPDTLRCRHFLVDIQLQQAVTAKDAARLNAGLKALQEVLDVRERVLGPEHPDTVHTKETLGDVLFKLGRREEAAKLFAEMVQGQTISLGADDPQTIASRHNLAVVLGVMGKLAEARKYHTENLELSKRTFGADHPNTLETTMYLAQVINMMAAGSVKDVRYEEAEKGFRQAIDLLEPVVAKDHANKDRAENLGHFFSNLAWMQVTATDPKYRNTKEALERAKKAVELCPQVRQVWCCLALAHYRNDDFQASLKALEEATKLSNGGTPNEWLIRAMIHCRQDEKDKARPLYDRAAEAIGKLAVKNRPLTDLLAEAAELLGVDRPKEPKP